MRLLLDGDLISTDDGDKKKTKGPPQLKKTHFFQFLAEIFLTPPPYDFQFPIVKFTQNPDAG